MAQPFSRTFYDRILTGELKAHLQQASEHGLEACNKDILLLAHAKIAQSVANEAFYYKNDRKIMAIATKLGETDDSFSEEYLERLRHKLKQLDEQTLTGLAEKLTRASGVLNQVASKQMEVSKDLFVQLFKLNHKPTTMLVQNALQTMLLQAGLSPKLHNDIIRAALENTEDEDLSEEELEQMAEDIPLAKENRKINNKDFDVSEVIEAKKYENTDRLLGLVNTTIEPFDPLTDSDNNTSPYNKYRAKDYDEDDLVDDTTDY